MNRHFYNKKPRPQDRPRTMVIGGHARVFKSHAQRAYEKEIAEEWPHEKMSGALAMAVTFRIARPKSHFNKSGLKESAPTHHQQRPDLDNLVKSVLDGLNKKAFDDDKSVVALLANKEWCDTEEEQGTDVDLFAFETGKPSPSNGIESDRPSLNPKEIVEAAHGIAESLNPMTGVDGDDPGRYVLGQWQFAAAFGSIDGEERTVVLKWPPFLEEEDEE